MTKKPDPVQLRIWDFQSDNEGPGQDDWSDLPEKTKEEVRPDATLWDLPKPDKWLPFNEARDFAHQYGFEYKEQWDDLIQEIDGESMPLPENIPANPHEIYKHTGWKNWKDWLISPERTTEYLDHYAAREFARCLRLTTKEQWIEYCKKEKPLHIKYNISIPKFPNLEYQDKGWDGWDDWLGITIDFKDFHTTRNYIRSLKLKSREDWKAYCCGESKQIKRKPKNIYAYPEIAYKSEGWKGWDDWLGLT